MNVVKLLQPKIHVKQNERIRVPNANDMIIFIFYFPTDSISNVKRASERVSKRLARDGQLNDGEAVDE